MVSWAILVLFAALFFGGGQVAPCLGLTNARCVEGWEASHPHPPPIFDITLAWPWIGLFVVGLTMILAWSRSRRPR